MNEFTTLCLIIAAILFLLAYVLNRPDTKARMQLKKEQRDKEKDIIYQYQKRIKELEEQNEWLRDALEKAQIIKEADMPKRVAYTEHESNTTLLWLVIIGLVAFLVYQGIQLSEINQMKGLLESIF